MKLRQNDAQAVDLLLDRAAATHSGNGGQNPMAYHAGVSNDRVAAAEKVLNLLNVMPESQPPADLTRRTMAFIDRMVASPAMREPIAPQIDHGRPVA